MMTNEDLKIILKKHHLWVIGARGGERANLRRTTLRGMDLSFANLRGADLSYAILNCTNLSYADLQDANLEGADLTCADLSAAYLKDANLKGADLGNANMRNATLNGTKGLPLSVDYMKANFERTDEGYIAYKIFGSQFSLPNTWKIKTGSVISENVNPNRCSSGGSGINVAPLAWVKKYYNGTIWKVLIRWEWLCGVVVPYHTTGKIRCERVELLGVVE